jgi:hypothetical protein
MAGLLADLFWRALTDCATHMLVHQGEMVCANQVRQAKMVCANLHQAGKACCFLVCQPPTTCTKQSKQVCGFVFGVLMYVTTANLRII